MLARRERIANQSLSEHVFASLAEASRIIEAWCLDYNTMRPHSSLGYATPDEFAATWHVANDRIEERGSALRPATGLIAAVTGPSRSDPLLDGPGMAKLTPDPPYDRREVGEQVTSDEAKTGSFFRTNRSAKFE